MSPITLYQLTSSISLSRNGVPLEFQTLENPGVTYLIAKDEKKDIFIRQASAMSFCIVRVLLSTPKLDQLEVHVQNPLVIFFQPFSGFFPYSYSGEKQQVQPYHFNFFKIQPGIYTITIYPELVYTFIVIALSPRILMENVNSCPFFDAFLNPKVSDGESWSQFFQVSRPTHLGLLIALHGLFRPIDSRIQEMRNTWLIQEVLFQSLKYAANDQGSMYRNLPSASMQQVYTMVQRVLDSVENPLLIPDLLAACLGSAKLTKNFKTMFGETPLQFLNQIRMRQALELLSHTSLTIKAVALMIGYKTTRTLRTPFVKYFGKNIWERVIALKKERFFYNLI